MTPSPPPPPCPQEAVIPGLASETTYSVTVAAYTTKGDGARSKAKVVTTTGAGEENVAGRVAKLALLVR